MGHDSRCARCTEVSARSAVAIAHRRGVLASRPASPRCLQASDLQGNGALRPRRDRRTAPRCRTRARSTRRGARVPPEARRTGGSSFLATYASHGVSAARGDRGRVAGSYALEPARVPRARADGPGARRLERAYPSPASRVEYAFGCGCAAPGDCDARTRGSTCRSTASAPRCARASTPSRPRARPTAAGARRRGDDARRRRRHAEGRFDGGALPVHAGRRGGAAPAATGSSGTSGASTRARWATPGPRARARPRGSATRARQQRLRATAGRRAPARRSSPAACARSPAPELSDGDRPGADLLRRLRLAGRVLPRRVQPGRPAVPHGLHVQERRAGRQRRARHSTSAFPDVAEFRHERAQARRWRRAPTWPACEHRLVVGVRARCARTRTSDSR